MAEDTEMAAAPVVEEPMGRLFAVQHQDVELFVDFVSQTLIGKTSIYVEPLSLDLKVLGLRSRQMDIKTVKIDRFAVADYKHDDPYKRITPRGGLSVRQHHFMDCGLERKPSRSDAMELTVPLPSAMLKDWERLKEAKAFVVHIEYVVTGSRDAIQWVGNVGDFRYPHVYTYSNSLLHTQACFVFPCVDQPGMRNSWKITVDTPRTLGDLAPPLLENETTIGTQNGAYSNGASSGLKGSERLAVAEHFGQFSEEEKMLEMSVVCSGFMEDTDAPIEDQATRRKWVFNCQTAVTPRHVGFAIGPFELVDLSQFRESEEDDKLGQSAVSVHGFCLPGRSEELRNSCAPMAFALDKISTDFAFYPFESSSSSYKLVFVDDLPFSVVDTATLSICSSRLLVPENVTDTLYDSTRELIHALASQWLGVKIVAKDPEDTWIIVGCSYFMADQLLMTLWGKNEHRFRLKQAADTICELDVRRLSIYDIGAELDVDVEEVSFLKMKAPMVLKILHHRIIKANGRNGVDRMIKRMLLDDQVGKLEDSEIETDRFKRIYEKVAHAKSDAFFNQWVYGAGCPTFQVSQRFNKKKLVVEMTISQSRIETLSTELTSDSFMRKVKEREELTEYPAPPLLFTGPMTIRIHEADGTPYEHIVDIRELTTKIEIPYNTKYKRLKRNKRQKERAAAVSGVDVDIQDDVLLYCLGDVLQSEEEVRDWDLVDWSQKEEDAMGNEHYEWIRLDKDSEWIARISFDNHPSYMWVSQLQQDNDVIAQVESIQWIARQPAEKLHATILVRTLMDTRYFYGVRVIAAYALARTATQELDWIGMRHLIKAFQEFFCFDGSLMPRANSFGDRRSYRIQLAIPEALALIRDSTGRAPNQVKEFFINQLKYNDNSSNEFSDAYYVSTLVTCLAKSLAGIGFSQGSYSFVNLEQEAKDMEFLEVALGMIHRYQRIDEFLPSYNNLYSVTALKSLKVLMQTKAITRKLGGMLQHTQPGNSEAVRLTAFDCLLDLGAFANPKVMTYFITTFCNENSPAVRSRLWQIISRGFGSLALTIPAVEQPVEPVDGLFVDDTTAQENRQTLLNRLQNVDEASAALKKQLQNNELIQETIMDGLRSDKIDLGNFLDLLTVCRLLYDTVDSFPVTLKYPQYWKVVGYDNGILRLKQTGKFRLKPYTKLIDRWPALGKKRAHPEENGVKVGDGSEAKKPRINTDLPMENGLPSAQVLPTPRLKLFSKRDSTLVEAPVKPPPPPEEPKQLEPPPAPRAPTRSATPGARSSLSTTGPITLQIPSYILSRFPSGVWSNLKPSPRPVSRPVSRPRSSAGPPPVPMKQEDPWEWREPTPKGASRNQSRQGSVLSPPPASLGSPTPPPLPPPPPPPPPAPSGEKKPGLKLRLSFKG